MQVQSLTSFSGLRIQRCSERLQAGCLRNGGGSRRQHHENKKDRTWEPGHWVEPAEGCAPSAGPRALAQPGPAAPAAASWPRARPSSCRAAWCCCSKAGPPPAPCSPPAGVSTPAGLRPAPSAQSSCAGHCTHKPPPRHLPTPPACTVTNTPQPPISGFTLINSAVV